MKLAQKIKMAVFLPLLLWIGGLALCLLFYQNSTSKTESFFNSNLKKQTLISEVYNSIGYGNGIHAFKNYVIRGGENYGQRALKKFNKAKNLLEEYKQHRPLTKEEISAIRLLTKTINEYITKLELAKKMKHQGRDIEQIDKAVKVDDTPAVVALEKFEQQFKENFVFRVNEVRSARSRTLALFLLTFLVSLFTAFVLSRRYSRQVLEGLQKLDAITRSIQSKDFDHRNFDIEKIEEDEIKSTAILLEETTSNLNKTILNLKKSNEDLEHFSFVAAHDLQEPIRKISNFADLVELESGKFLDENGKLYISKIRNTSERMTGLVRSLLEYSRLVNKEIVHVPVDLNSLVEDMTSVLYLNIKNENANIEISDLPIVFGDHELLAVVLNNLISNALKFRKSEVNPKIRIFAEKVRSDVWRITIEDNGIGIDKRNFDEILKPFVRAHKSIGQPGFGVGLSVCKRILASLNSELFVSSSPGQGSRFSFELKSA